MAGRRLLYLIGVIGAAVFYLMYQKWVSWMVLLIVLLLPWLSLIVSLRAMFTTRAKLLAPEKITVGNSAQVRLETECSSEQLPVSCRIRVTKPLTEETWMINNGSSLSPAHCGTLELCVEKAVVYDHIGLFRRKIRHVPNRVVQVMPKPLPMPVPEDLNHFLSYAWRPKAGGGYAENHEIRTYHPGDMLNLVHWKMSAKMNTLMLREPMEPGQMKVVLTVELCGTPEELDRKFGRLLWMGHWLLERKASFSVLALTGKGVGTWEISESGGMDACLGDLLGSPCIRHGDNLAEHGKNTTAWQICIGGEPNED